MVFTSFTSKKIVYKFLFRRIEETEACIIIKENKLRLASKVQSRLMNPAKSNLILISKLALDRINKKLVTLTNMNRCRNTQAVLELSNTTENKKNVPVV